MTVASSLRLSERARNLKPSATLAVSARVKALCAAGVDVVGFGAGEPDFDTPDAIKEVAIQALRAGMTGYQPVPGIPEARESIARKLATENGIAASADHVIISAGAKHSLYLALQALVDPGDEVVVPTPAWVSYIPMIGLCGGRAVEVRGATDNDFKITPTQLEAALTDRTAVLILNSPSNPCGTMYSPSELRALADVVAGHGRVVVISDEIYEKLIYTEVPHFSIGSLNAIGERVVTVNGLSKAFAMTGWRLGYAYAPGDDGAIARSMARLQGQMTSHPTAFAVPAVVDALTNRAADVERMRQAFAERAVVMHEQLQATPDVICPRPTGAFYVFPDVSRYFGGRSPGGRLVDGAMAFAEALLEEARVGVVPGNDFGAGGESHVRLSFACATDTIVEGCTRMRRWLEGFRDKQ